MVLKSWSTDRWIKLSLAIHVLVPQVKVILLHCEVLIVASTFWACYPTAALNDGAQQQQGQEKLWDVTLLVWKPPQKPDSVQTVFLLF